MQTQDGSLVFVNTVVRWNSTANESYTTINVNKMDRYGHTVWENEYSKSEYVHADAVFDNGNDTFTVFNIYCNTVIIDLNGTFLSKEILGDDRPLCQNLQPSLHGNADSHALDLLGIDRNTSYNVWTLPDGYISTMVKRDDNDIKINLTKYNLLGNLTDEYNLEKTFSFPVGRYPGVALIEQARDGGLIVVGYNWW